MKRSTAKSDERALDDAFWSGYNAALGVVYSFNGDPTCTLAREIVLNGNAAAQLRVAKKEGDCYMAHLRKTIRSMR